MPDHSYVARDALRFNLLFQRAKWGLSQKALAQQVSISRPLVSDLEHGRANVTLDILERLAAVLEVSVPDLLTPVHAGTSEADLERRSKDGPDAFVDARDFLVAVDDDLAAKTTGSAARFSRRGRKAAVPA